MRKEVPKGPKESSGRLDLQTYIDNPDLPMYDPKRFRMPKELTYSKVKVPFTGHPRSEMERTLEEIFSFNKLRSEEDVKSAAEFF